MAKDKKKKKDKKAGKKAGTAGRAARKLKTLSQNPLVADIVAAALVATAAALKDSKKARQLAEQAGDELMSLAKEGSERGNALWKLALDIGRRSIDALGREDGASGKKPAQSKQKSK